MKKSHLIIITCIILAGAFGLALMVHFANRTTPQPVTKTHKTAEKQAQSDKPKPQIRQTNSDPTLVKYLNEYYRSEEDLERSIDDLELTQYTQEDHNRTTNLYPKYTPQQGTEPHKITVPLGLGGGAFEHSILNRYVEYRATANPELLTEKSRQDLEKINWDSIIKDDSKPEFKADTIEAKFGLACSRLNGRIIGENVFNDCKKIITRNNFNREKTESNQPISDNYSKGDTLLLSDDL